MANAKAILFLSAGIIAYISSVASKMMLENLGSTTFQSGMMISSTNRFLDNNNSTNVNAMDTTIVETAAPRKSGMVNFLHIPKTAGTTIETISGKHNHTCGLWGSRMVGDEDLGRAHPWTAEGHLYWQQSFVIETPTGNVTTTCAEWHTPPSYLSVERRRDLFPAEETFCILRDPLERLISAFYHNYYNPVLINGTYQHIQGPCFDDSVEYANVLLEKELKTMININPALNGCHFLPQTQFLRGFGKDKGDSLQCNHVLIMEKNLSKQFNQLMTKVNCSIRFPSETLHSNKHVHTCRDDPTLYGEKNKHLQNKAYTPITTNDLNEKVLKLAKEFYKEDFEVYRQYASVH